MTAVTRIMIRFLLHSLAVVAALEEGILDPKISASIAAVAVVVLVVALVIVKLFGVVITATAALIAEVVSAVVVRADRDRNKDLGRSLG